MDLAAVRKTYARWAPFYDATFGALTQAGRRQAVRHINRSTGAVLELGVGTGLSLGLYAPHLAITGIDFSEAMLARARDKVARQGLAQVRALRQMDARHLDFPDASFDTVAAMHVLSVVPDPEQVMAEIARVLVPGGALVITNHFARDAGLLARLERWFAPLEAMLGWQSDFPRARVLGEPSLRLVSERALPPMGMMTLMVLTKV